MSILQFYDSTWTHTLPKNTDYDHWLLLAYNQFYTSTILRFCMNTHVTKNTNYDHWLQTIKQSNNLRCYINTHVTKKHRLWSLTTTSIFSILQFYTSRILHKHTRYQKTETIIIDFKLSNNQTIYQTHLSNNTTIQLFIYSTIQLFKLSNLSNYQTIKLPNYPIIQLFS